MNEKNLPQRAQDLLDDVERRLHVAEHYEDVESPETKAKIQWLQARRAEIKTILSFAGESDAQLERAARMRIRRLENDPWDAGGHSKYVDAKKPNT
jgi:hypothetical protein